MEWYAATNRIRNVSIYCSWHNQVKKKRQGEEKRVSDASAKSDSVTINTYPRVLFSFSGRWHLHWHFEDTANGRCDNFIFVCMLSCFSRVWLFVIPWTVARQAPLSMGFSGQEHWSGLPCPPPGDLPDPGVKPASLVSPALAGAAWEAHVPPQIKLN